MPSCDTCGKCFATFERASFSRFGSRYWFWPDEFVHYYDTKSSQLSSYIDEEHTTFMSCYLNRDTFNYIGTIACNNDESRFSRYDVKSSKRKISKKMHEKKRSKKLISKKQKLEKLKYRKIYIVQNG